MWPVTLPMGLMGDLGLLGIRRAKFPRASHSALRKQYRSTSAKGISALSTQTGCGSPAFPGKREAPPSMYALLRVVLHGFCE